MSDVNNELYDAMIRRGFYDTEYQAVRARRKYGSIYFPVPFRGGYVLY